MHGDLRAALQYIPSFRGGVFVVVLNGDVISELSLAEVMLDLAALQQIDVGLVLVSTGIHGYRFTHRLIDVGVRWQEASRDLGEIREVLGRGQMAFIQQTGLAFDDLELVELALEVGAKKMIVFGDEEFGMGEALSISEALEHSSHNVVRAAALCEKGVPRVHFLSKDRQGVLMDELFSNEGVGVMVYSDDYVIIREVTKDDIAELLAMVGRSVRDERLVPRSYEGIEECLGDYLVMVVDGNVVGCVALHSYFDSQCGEIACLYVKQSHGGRGYGQRLVIAAEQKAKGLGLSRVFALSNRAVEFFENQLGYEKGGQHDLPEARRALCESSGRWSTPLWKTLSVT